MCSSSAPIAAPPAPDAEQAQDAMKVVLWTGSQVAGLAFGAAFGPSIASFVQSNLPVLMEAAATFGPSFQGWFMGVMSKIPELAPALETYRKARKD